MDTYLIIKSILPFCSLGCKALQARESSVPGHLFAATPTLTHRISQNSQSPEKVQILYSNLTNENDPTQKSNDKRKPSTYSEFTAPFIASTA